MGFHVHYRCDSIQSLNESVNFQTAFVFHSEIPSYHAMSSIQFIAFNVHSLSLSLSRLALIWCSLSLSRVIRFNKFFLLNVKFKHQVQLLNGDYLTVIAINSTSSMFVHTWNSICVAKAIKKSRKTEAAANANSAWISSLEQESWAFGVVACFESNGECVSYMRSERSEHPICILYQLKRSTHVQFTYEPSPSLPPQQNEEAFETMCFW